MIPRLHVVTDDAVLADGGFLATAAAIGRALGGDVALHLRGHHTPARRLHALVAALAGELEGTGARILVADRADVALATPGVGVRIGVHSIPVPAARALLGDRLLACSVHGSAEGEEAARTGADFLVVGTIWRTASHPDRPGAGTALLEVMAERVGVPVVAIGGVTPARAREALAVGAAGVAVLRGVWAAADPVAAASGYIDAMDGAARTTAGGAGP